MWAGQLQQFRPYIKKSIIKGRVLFKLFGPWIKTNKLFGPRTIPRPRSNKLFGPRPRPRTISRPRTNKLFGTRSGTIPRPRTNKLFRPRPSRCRSQKAYKEKRLVLFNT